MGEAKPSPPLVTQGAEPARAHSPPARPERRRQGGEVSGADLPGPRPECRFFASRTRCPCALSPAQRKSERGRPVHTCIPSSLSIGCHRRGRRVARTRPPRPLSRARLSPARGGASPAAVTRRRSARPAARLAREPLPQVSAQPRRRLPGAPRSVTCLGRRGRAGRVAVGEGAPFPLSPGAAAGSRLCYYSEEPRISAVAIETGCSSKRHRRVAGGRREPGGVVG